MVLQNVFSVSPTNLLEPKSDNLISPEIMIFCKIISKYLVIFKAVCN